MKDIKETMISYDIRSDILKMNQDQLNLVIQSIKDRRTMLQLEEKAKFSVGDKVWFEHKGVKKHGFIKKLNSKTIQVEITATDNGLIGAIWNVSATYLNKY